MGNYSPLKITGLQGGLVMERENFLLPDDAYPVLENAYVWRERILRKRGYELLGRLQRYVDSSATYGGYFVAFDGSGNSNLLTTFHLEAGGSIVPGTVEIIDGATTYTDPAMNGTLSPSGTINYATGAIHSAAAAGHVGASANLFYNPNLPVMGIRTRETQASVNDETIFFDQKYAYIYNSITDAFEEFLPLTAKRWNASGQPVSGTDFFFSTNYWVSATAFSPFGTSNRKLFWETNNTGQFAGLADPPRITDGDTWVDFFPSTWSQIDATNYLTNWLAMLPYRGRMVVVNTWEGPTAAGSLNYSNRIRWSTIGNPFIPYTAGPPARGSWRDDIRGQGGFLDIPTSEDIVAIGFVRDNMVIYCERSTWQLRYTGRSIAPFQIERVNSELGAEGTFSAVQFDTSLIGIGDKGIVECDSYQSKRIDIKIPDLVFHFNSQNLSAATQNGPQRVHGIRDFINRLAYWTILADSPDSIFPNQRLVYNYENDSWALFTDSLTTLGTFQPTSSRTWLNTPTPWDQANFTWVDQPASVPSIVGGNQQGFIEYLDELTTNDVSLYISAITAHTTTPTVVTSPNHNMETGFVVKISGIPATTPFSSFNGAVFGIVVLTPDTFQLWKYNPIDDQFSTPQLDATGSTYVGGGLIAIRDNFNITSKKFNFLDEGQSIQIGYIDILMSSVSNTLVATGSPGNTDGSGNLLGILNLLLPIPSTSTIVPGSFIAIVGPNRYTEVYPPDGNLLVNDIPAPPGSFVNHGTTQVGLVTGLATTPVYVSFRYYLSTPVAEISLNMYLDYDDNTPSNTLPSNNINDGSTITLPDTFFNSIIPTSQSPLSDVEGTKFWQRVYCSTSANFLTLQYTFNNSQMAYTAQENDVQIDAQIIWLRRGGRMVSV